MKWYEDEEYWLMCERAEEIQGIADKAGYILGGFYVCKGAIFVYDGSNNFGVWEDFDAGKAVYLPSQEDLQETMFKYFDDDKWLKLTNTLNGFIFWWDTGNVARGKFDSMTKLWLAFVMHELYQKKWNPEKKEWEVKNAIH